MKKIILMLVTTTVYLSTLAQELPKAREFSKEQYQQISKRQATTGWILLGSGVAVGTAGYFLFRDNFNLFGETNTEGNAGAWMLLGGTASVLTSGGFFIASGVNRGRAKELSLNLKMERGVPIVLQGVGPGYYPAVSVRLTLK